MPISRITLALFLLAAFTPQAGAAQAPATGRVVVEDFQQERDGALPSRWQFLSGRDQAFQPLERHMDKDERFYIVQEQNNRFLRGYTKGEAQRITLGNGRGHLDWDLRTHPRLAWDWRALQLPVGAREDKVNDAGGAVYVSFDRKDWLGRPFSIKYTYSSTLPVGTVVSSGNVKVIVVSSGVEGFGRWQRVERNVAEDYRRLFDEDPPDRPFAITLWSDSDNTKTAGEVDFDNLTLLR